jgi:cytochrome P450
MQLQAEKGVLTDSWVTSMCMTNFAAGIETTAITISTLVNFIVGQNCQERAHEEIDKARNEGTLINPPKLREMREYLPYLTACLNESMRLHPVVGMPLVRAVPDSGCELEGYFLPAGVCSPSFKVTVKLAKC